MTRKFHPRELKTGPYTKKLHVLVCISVICNNQKGEIIEMPIPWWTDKENVVYPHSGILFSREKNETLTHVTCVNTTCYNMLPHGWTLKTCLVKEARSIKGPHIVSYCLHEMPRIGKSTEAESRTVVARAWEERRIGSDCQWLQEF